jgi:hypothetical protein
MIPVIISKTINLTKSDRRESTPPKATTTEDITHDIAPFNNAKLTFILLPF